MAISRLETAVAVSRALGHRARLRTLAMLRSGELCGCQLSEVLRLAQSTVSSHLRELKRAGLVVERKSGRWVHFGLSDDAEVRPWVDAALLALRNDPQIASDASQVEEMRRLPLEDVCRFGYAAAKAKACSESSASA